MTVTLNKWRIYCNTEETWTHIWLELGTNPPTTCSTNTSHSVNANSVSITDTLSSNDVIIQEETTKTQGNFRLESFSMDIPANSTYTLPIQFPYNISLCSAIVHVKPSNVDDIVNSCYQPCYQGYITSNINSNISTIHIDSVSLSILNVGYEIILKRLSDNHTDKLGEIIAINKNTGTITVSNPTTVAFNNNDTFVFQVHGIKNMILESIGVNSIGNSKIGSSFLHSSGTIYVTYINMSTTDAKTFVYDLEYLY